MKALLARIKEMIVETWQVGDRIGRSKAVEVIEGEVEEMENIFGLLVLGSFVGMPSPPMQISLDLMPYMEKELILMLEKVDTASEPISQLFSIFNIG
jgi:hypothetical protein